MFFFLLLFSQPVRTKSALLLDYYTGRILYQKSIHTRCYPASLTKKMTLYILFKALRDKKISLNTNFKVSRNAENQAPTKLGLRCGERISVRNIILGLIVKSANDAAVVAAEGISGSVPAFAKLMNFHAKRLGMTHSCFYNPSGLHHPHQRTTAHDMCKMALALYRDFPQFYHFFNTTHFSFRGKILESHNKLVCKENYIDGIKTGYIYASGYNITTSALCRDSSGHPHRLFVIVIGEDCARTRDRKVVRLLNCYFPHHKSF